MIVELGEKPEVSVVIGLVSTEDGARILETLTSLHERQGPRRCEVVLADRRCDAVSAEIKKRFPQVAIIECSKTTTLPEMRAMAYARTGADLVAVTEDHCVPADGWLGQIHHAFDGQPESTSAIGGVVENGVHDTAFDWATYLCEYSYFSAPVVEGATEILPGMNVVYRRSALESVPKDALLSGFWETTVHPLLVKQGKVLISRNAIKMYHCKKFSAGLFFRQRYVYSQYYAGLRFPAKQIAKRVFAAVVSLALPPVLFWRMTNAALRKGLGAQFLRASPALAALVVVWSIGEIRGYIFGPGKALAQIE